MPHPTIAASCALAAGLMLARPLPSAAEAPRGTEARAVPGDARATAPASEEVVSAAGERLASLLDAMEVEKHWLAGRHVSWRTGEPDGRPVGPQGAHSHCSAFVAAASSRLAIPILEPPEHPQILLASAQCGWLRGEGRTRGWLPLRDGLEAQRYANAGNLVVACTRSPDPDEPGHIAIVRPAASTARRIEAEGPQVIQAGVRNWNSTSLKRGFENHPWAWAHGRIRYFAHALPNAAFGPGRPSDALP